MKKALDSYGFSKEVKDSVKPVVQAVDQMNIVEAQQELAGLALAVCRKIEDGLIKPNVANDCFTLIDLYLGDIHPTVELGEDISALLFEGMLFHDYGTEFGPDLERMKRLANMILRK